MSGPFSEIILGRGRDMSSYRRAILLDLARADDQPWTGEQDESGWTDHMAEIMYGRMADVLIDHCARALDGAAAEIHNGAGDPEQEFYDHGVSPWLTARANLIRAEIARPFS